MVHKKWIHNISRVDLVQVVARGVYGYQTRVSLPRVVVIDPKFVLENRSVVPGSVRTVVLVHRPLTGHLRRVDLVPIHSE